MLLPNQIYTWITTIIISCNNDFQFICVDKLIELFKQHFPEENLLSASLEELRKEHEQTIQQLKATNTIN